jgi:nucleoside-diphosphate-sugar epimerase
MRSRLDLSKFENIPWDPEPRFLELPHILHYNNIVGTLNLLEIMVYHGCKKLLLSSFATVCSQPKEAHEWRTFLYV